MHLVFLFMPHCSFNIFSDRKTGKGHVNSQGILRANVCNFRESVDINFCMRSVDPNGETNANQPTHLFLLP